MKKAYNIQQQSSSIKDAVYDSSLVVNDYNPNEDDSDLNSMPFESKWNQNLRQ